ncbi:DUF3238 domain-containing protein [Brevibacillus borstelensis]|uniref:DUF3238 domain-containing protein n=1 Tax=Brevibacillus borstelensis TaxID=45462 RepID=UPI0030C2A991
MAYQVAVRVTAFIPEKWIEFMRTSKVMILYNGNNRYFKYDTLNDKHAYKLCSHVQVDFTNKKVYHYPGVGPTIERTVDIETGEPIRPDITGQASDSGVKCTFWQFGSGPNGEHVDIILEAAVNIPTFNPSPDIDWKYNIRVFRDGKVTVQGTHDAYPAHEIWKKVDNERPLPLHTYDPRSTGETVYTGLLKFNQKVSVIRG